MSERRLYIDVGPGETRGVVTLDGRPANFNEWIDATFGEGLAQVFMRPYNGGMMLHTMYYSEEIRQVDQFGAPDVELKEAEVKVAHQLIQALATKFEPEKYHDNFEENLRKLIEAHLEHRAVPTVEKPRKMAPVVDLMAALKESLAQMEGKKKPAARAEAARAEASAAAPRRAARKRGKTVA